MFDKKLQLPLNENDSLQIPTSQLTLLVVTKKTTQICRYLLIKKTMNKEKTFCINQQLIQLDFTADFYFLKCYKTFAHIFIRIRKLI